VPEVRARLGSGREVSVRLSGDRELRRLNRDFLGEDATTDVLSFPSGEEGGYLGDIALSWPAIRRQASEYGHTVEAETAVLCVHGLLHLLGWDHRTPSEEREMWRLTRACLAAARVAAASGRLQQRP
jgi:probable rRNA maturation factor